MNTKDILIALRKARNLSQKQVAAEAGIPYSTYSKHETGERELGLQSAAKLADYYGVTIDSLVGREQQPQDPVEDLSKKIGLSPIEKAIVAAYMAFDAEDRRKLVTMVQGLSSGVDEDVKKSMTVTTQTGTDKDKVSNEEAAAKDA